MTFSKSKSLKLALLALSAQAETDCRNIINDWYKISCPDEMKCSGDFACSFDPTNDDPCSQYECLSKNLCPEDTTYMDYWTDKNEQAGYACTPPEKEPENFLECDWSDGELKIDGRLKSIIRHSTANDNRNYTLISLEKWEKYMESNPKPITIFDTSSCVGTENKGTGITIFQKVKNNDDCVFTNGGMQFNDEGVPFYVQSVVIGYDDLTIYNPMLDQTEILKYGVTTKLHCRISAFDTLFVDPGADGKHDEREKISDTDVNFSIGMYSNPEFTEELQSGDLISIDPDSTDETVYIQLEADVGNEQTTNMIHIKQCKYNTYTNVTGEWEPEDNEYTFMMNGCLIENDYLKQIYQQKETRTNWTDDQVKTYAVDQFRYAVPQSMIESLLSDGEKFSKIVLECSVVACQVDMFARTDEDYQAETSICYLSDVCDGRYSNLMQKMARGVAPREKDTTYERYNMTDIKKTDEFEIIFYNSSKVTQLGISLLTFILLNLVS